MKTLFDKCCVYDFKTLFAKKGYAFFTKGNYNLNIIGIRSNQHNIVTNIYDDILVVDYNTSAGHARKVYTITTDPGETYMLNPTNSEGTAILVPGQYRGAYRIDLHNGKYEALCQRLGKVKVYRDGNRNKVYDLDPKTIKEGMFGINIHRASNIKDSSFINSWSAGCQVFAYKQEFNSFMRLCKLSKDIYGNKFTYTLLTEEDLK